MRLFGWDEVYIGTGNLTSTSGLALVGQLIQRSGLPDAFDRLEPLGRPERTGGGTSVSSLCGLIALGHLDFDHNESLRKDPASARSMGIRKVPSSPTLRQRTEVLCGATCADKAEAGCLRRPWRSVALAHRWGLRCRRDPARAGGGRTGWRHRRPQPAEGDPGRLADHRPSARCAVALRGNISLPSGEILGRGVLQGGAGDAVRTQSPATKAEQPGGAENRTFGSGYAGL